MAKEKKRSKSLRKKEGKNTSLATAKTRSVSSYIASASADKVIVLTIANVKIAKILCSFKPEEVSVLKKSKKENPRLFRDSLFTTIQTEKGFSLQRKKAAVARRQNAKKSIATVLPVEWPALLFVNARGV